MRLPLFSPFRLLCRQLLPGMLALLLTSCSGPAFQRAWKQAQSQPPADPVSGPWIGTWKSDSNGHQGQLQCVVTPPDKPGAPHQFYYRATWMRFLSGAYRAEHQVKPSGKSAWKLSGQHRMPAWAGGLYTYEGNLTPESFSARYECEIDHGTYTLQRPESTATPNNTLAKSQAKP
jgi:hypothetical protein